jgi:hypothetical protein
MVKYFIVALSAAFTFFILKFIEMRFILKQSNGIKHIVRDTILVYISMLGGQFIGVQIEPFQKNMMTAGSTQVFTGSAEF